MNGDILEILTSPGDWPSPGCKAILDALNTIFGAWITLIHYCSKWWPAEEAFREPSAVSQHSSGSACPESVGQSPLPACLGFYEFPTSLLVHSAQSTQYQIFQRESFTYYYKRMDGTCVVDQWLRLCLPIQGVWIRSLVGELRSHMPQGQKPPQLKAEAIL